MYSLTNTAIFTPDPSTLNSKDATRSGRAFSVFLTALTIALAIVANVVQTNTPIQLPSDTLDWEARFLPLAQKYMSVSSTSNPNTVLSGLTVLITGAATNAMGRSLTKSLTSKGATVIATGRSPTKLRQLQQQTSSYSGTVVPIVMKVGDLQDVELAASLIEQAVPSIDVVINSAGMQYINYNRYYDDDYFLSTYNLAAPSMSPERGRTAFSVNFLSHVLLVEKLMPLVRKSKRQPTVLHVSSSKHWGGKDIEATLQSHAYDTYQIPLASSVNTKLTQIVHALSVQLEARGGRIRHASIFAGEVSATKANSAALKEAYAAMFALEDEDDFDFPEHHWFAIHDGQ